MHRVETKSLDCKDLNTKKSTPLTKAELKVTLQTFPVFPREVRLKDIKDNGKLESENETKLVQSKINKTDHVIKIFSKKELSSSYRVLSMGKNKAHFIIYKGKTAEIKNQNTVVDSDSEDEEIDSRRLPYILGEGSFGVVKICQNALTKEWYAIKFIDANYCAPNQEFEILEKLGLSVLQLERLKKGNSELPQRIILMKFAPGENLADFLTKRQNLEADIKCAIILGMLQCVLEIQQNNVIHRDIKLENFRYDPITRKVTLVDFGVSLLGRMLANEAIRGAPGYVAPEHKKEHGNFVCYESDIYALGLCIALVLELHLEEVINEDRAGEISEIEYYLDPNAIDTYNNSSYQALLAFIARMTAANPMVRPPIIECIDFFKKIQNEVLSETHFNIGIIDMSNLIQSHNPHKKKAFQQRFLALISLLKEKNYDEIWFIDIAGHATVSQKEQMKRRLLKHKINVGNKIFYAPGAKMNEVIQQIHEVLPTFNNSNQYSYFKIDGNGAIKPILFQVTECNLLSKQSFLSYPLLTKKVKVKKPSKFSSNTH